MWKVIRGRCCRATVVLCTMMSMWFFVMSPPVHAAGPLQVNPLGCEVKGKVYSVEAEVAISTPDPTEIAIPPTCLYTFVKKEGFPPVTKINVGVCKAAGTAPGTAKYKCGGTSEIEAIAITKGEVEVTWMGDEEKVRSVCVEAEK